MKTIILTLSLIFTSAALAQGSITIHGDYAFNLAQELPESTNFSCDLNPVHPTCVIKTKIIRGKDGKVIFSGDVAKELHQVPGLDGVLCNVFANLETFCQLDSRPDFSIDEGNVQDEFQKIDNYGFSVKIK